VSAPLSQGLDLLDALHEVRGEREPAQTPEALVAMLTDLCERQAIGVVPEEITRAVERYQAKRTAVASTEPVAGPRMDEGVPSFQHAALGGIGAAAVWAGIMTILLGGRFPPWWLVLGLVAFATLSLSLPRLAMLGTIAWTTARGRRAARPRAATDLAPKKATVPPTLHWTQDRWTHPMEKGHLDLAMQESSKFELKSPYEGRQRLAVMVMRHPTSGQVAVGLGLPKGMFETKASMRVRFGEEESERWAIHELGYGREPTSKLEAVLRERHKNTLYLRDGAKFVAKMKRHATMTLEVPFYGNGLQIITVDTAGFAQAMPEA